MQLFLVAVSVSEEVAIGSWCLVLQSSDVTHTVFVLQEYLSLFHRGDGCTVYVYAQSCL